MQHLEDLINKIPNENRSIILQFYRSLSSFVSQTDFITAYEMLSNEKKQLVGVEAFTSFFLKHQVNEENIKYLKQYYNDFNNNTITEIKAKNTTNSLFNNFLKEIYGNKNSFKSSKEFFKYYISVYQKTMKNKLLNSDEKISFLLSLLQDNQKFKITLSSTSKELEDFLTSVRINHCAGFTKLTDFMQIDITNLFWGGVIKHHLKPMLLNQNVNLEDIKSISKGFSDSEKHIIYCFVKYHDLDHLKRYKKFSQQDEIDYIVYNIGTLLLANEKQSNHPEAVTIKEYSNIILEGIVQNKTFIKYTNINSKEKFFQAFLNINTNILDDNQITTKEEVCAKITEEMLEKTIPSINKKQRNVI